eukprot:6205082-Pleurochrysis_carterae.AAC.2
MPSLLASFAPFIDARFVSARPRIVLSPLSSPNQCSNWVSLPLPASTLSAPGTSGASALSPPNLDLVGNVVIPSVGLGIWGVNVVHEGDHPKELTVEKHSRLFRFYPRRSDILPLTTLLYRRTRQCIPRCLL